MIHPTAIIDPATSVGENVGVGPYCVVAGNCSIGDGTVLGPHVVIEEHTHIGRDCTIGSGAVLGGLPQDLKYKGERSYVRIGDRNQIREFVSIHRATGEEQSTTLGSDNLVMAYAHLGHNCSVGDHCMLSSYTALAGHITAEDYVIFGGLVGVHQYVRIGKLAMIGAYSKVVQDIPPFMLADGRPADVLDLNVRGLRRAGMEAETRAALKSAYKLLYRSNLNMTQALEAIADKLESDAELSYLTEFIKRIHDGTSGRQDDRPRR